ncbi:tripartite tricarboxylate transporter TctB family protein [Nocardiopsis coralliicola]
MDDGDADAAAEAPAPPPASRAASAGAACAVLALGAAGAAGSVALGLGSPAQPGPGLWPLLVSALLVLLGAVLLVQARAGGGEAFGRSSLTVAAGLATMAGFAAVVGTVGFEIPAVVLAVIWLRFLGGESWRLSLITAVATVAVFYAVFVGALGVPIPHLF